MPVAASAAAEAGSPAPPSRPQHAHIWLTIRRSLQLVPAAGQAAALRATHGERSTPAKARAKRPDAPRMYSWLWPSSTSQASPMSAPSSAYLRWGVYRREGGVRWVGRGGLGE